MKIALYLPNSQSFLHKNKHNQHRYDSENTEIQIISLMSPKLRFDSPPVIAQNSAATLRLSGLERNVSSASLKMIDDAVPVSTK